jgi:hypothetical protein
VQVLEAEHQRPRRRQPVQEAPPGGELLLTVGGGRRFARLGADQAAQVAGDPGGGGRVVDGVGDRVGQPASASAGPVGLHDARLGLDRLGERPEGRPMAPRQGAALPPDDLLPLGGQPGGQLGEQPGLADAGNADHGDQLRDTVPAGPAEGVEQDPQLGGAGDQRREGPVVGSQLGGDPVAPGQRRPGRLAAGRPAGGVGDGSLGCRPGRLGDQDDTGGRRLLQPGADAHRVAEHPLGGRTATTAANQRLPGGHGGVHPHRPGGGRSPRELRRQGVADRESGEDRPLRVVVAGPRHTEHGHGAAADGLLDHPAERLDLGPHPGQVAGEHPPDVLGVALGEVVHRLVDVDEEHGDELALGAVRRGGACHAHSLAADAHSVACRGCPVRQCRSQRRDRTL